MKRYAAEIISIGNELLAGYTINTNASYISLSLMEIGLPVSWVTTISDQHDEILNALQLASERADAILITGGLGPTPDDITKKTICDFFNVDMVLNEQALEDVKNFLEARGRALSESNKEQALIPSCEAVISNGVGTAPGLVFERNNRHFFFMPGVPGEMKYMVSNFITDYLKRKIVLAPVHNRLLRTTGIPESRLYDRIRPLLQKFPQFDVAFLPRYIGVDLRFRSITGKKNEIESFDTFVNTVHQDIAKYVFTTKQEELEQTLGRILTEQKQTLAVAESFTGGLLSDLITNIPGCSDYFLGGVVSYSNTSKINELEVNPETIGQFGAVSEQTALEMVRGVKKRFNSDCAISTTGIAGPGGATETKKIGLSYVAAICGEKVTVREFHFGPERLINKKRGAVAGMEMLRRFLLKIV